MRSGGSQSSAPIIDRRALARDFDAAAADYDRVAVLQRTVAERLLERLDLIRLTPQRILDLGSGSGRAAGHLAKRYRRAQILQMDLALNMLKVARRRGPRWFSRQHYVQADAAAALPLAAASLDFVFSSLMLQWIEEPEPVFGELRRCLRAGGLILFSSFGPDTLHELRDSWSAADDTPHVNLFMDMHNVGDALIRAGFADPVMEVEYFQLSYRDGYALMHELKQLGAQNVLAGRRRSLTGRRRLQAMLAAYEQYRDENGRLPATFEVVYGHAWVPETARQSRDPDSGEVRVSIDTLRRRQPE